MHRRLAGLLSLTALIAPLGSVQADSDPVVVTVGSTSLRASEVARRLAQVPAYQRKSLGASPQAAARRFVDTVLVPELLVDQDAGARKLLAAPGTRSRVHDALRVALEADLLRTLRQERPVTAADVEAYYAAHRADYERPASIELWRIVVRDEALARRILLETRGAGGPERWRALAREHSVDEATKLRGGALGFVMADGRTEVPQVQVDPALYAAASAVRDGELLAEPVREGDLYAVVWRRGSRPAESRSLADEAPRIRGLLERQRLHEARSELLARLRKEHVRDLEPDLLEELPEATKTGAKPLVAPEPAPSGAGAQPSGATKAPVPESPAPSGAAPGDPAPRNTPSGLR